MDGESHGQRNRLVPKFIEESQGDMIIQNNRVTPQELIPQLPGQEGEDWELLSGPLALQVNAALGSLCGIKKSGSRES